VTLTDLQWGGRFASAPEPQLLAFGSSLGDDLILAAFDVQCSHGHVIALERGGLIVAADAAALHAALDRVAGEIVDGTFAAFAQGGAFEDVHGAIDARVRELVPAHAGESLHAGRSRNDQVATTLLLYARERADRGARLSLAIANAFLERAASSLERGSLLAATTHWQPAQPVLFSFWLTAAAQPFIRAAGRFARVKLDASAFCPLGSSALAGSSLALDRDAAARALGFTAPSRNALDSVGDRDVALDLLTAVTRATVAASRPSEEFVIWSTPAFGYAQLDDSAATGSSLMPQKKNPDPFELVRAAGARLIGALGGALATTNGIGLSYHRDLQETKSLIVRGTEHGLAALDAFSRALAHLAFDEARMTAHATTGFTIATDVADALIARGATARQAHRLVGTHVLAAEQAGRALDASDLAALGETAGMDGFTAPLDGPASVAAKRTVGSTSPTAVRDALAASRDDVRTLREALG